MLCTSYEHDNNTTPKWTGLKAGPLAKVPRVFSCVGINFSVRRLPGPMPKRKKPNSTSHLQESKREINYFQLILEAQHRTVQAQSSIIMYLLKAGKVNFRLARTSENQKNIPLSSSARMGGVLGLGIGLSSFDTSISAGKRTYSSPIPPTLCHPAISPTSNPFGGVRNSSRQTCVQYIPVPHSAQHTLQCNVP